MIPLTGQTRISAPFVRPCTERTKSGLLDSSFQIVEDKLSFHTTLQRMDTEEEESDLEKWEEITITKNCLFGYLVLLALYLETEEIKKKTYDKIIDSITSVKSGLFSRLGTIFRVRLGYETGEILRDEIREYGLSTEEADLLWRWSQREVNFIKK